MSLKSPIKPPELQLDAFPEDLIIDLHGLAAILLRERLFLSSKNGINRFKHSCLAEINTGAWFATSIPLIHQQTWHALEAPKVGYFLTQRDANSKSKGKAEVREIGEDGKEKELPPVEPANFLHKYVRSCFPLDTVETELIFNRVRAISNAYVLAYAMQQLLCALPASTKLRVRSSEGTGEKGVEIICPAHEFACTELILAPRTNVYVCNSVRVLEEGEDAIRLDHYVVGGKDSSEPWVYFTFTGVPTSAPSSSTSSGTNNTSDDLKLADGSAMATDTDPAPLSDQETKPVTVALDLAAPLLGLRGLGGESYVLTSLDKYEKAILARGAETDLERIRSSRIGLRHGSNIRAAEELAGRVLNVLEGMASAVKDEYDRDKNIEKETRRTEDMQDIEIKDADADVPLSEPSPSTLTEESTYSLSSQLLGSMYCSHCGRSDPRPRAQCSRCKGRARYCGQACQRKAWSYHKTWCYKDVPPPAPPPKQPTPPLEEKDKEEEDKMEEEDKTDGLSGGKDQDEDEGEDSGNDGDYQMMCFKVAHR